MHLSGLGTEKPCDDSGNKNIWWREDEGKGSSHTASSGIIYFVAADVARAGTSENKRQKCRFSTPPPMLSGIERGARKKRRESIRVDQ